MSPLFLIISIMIKCDTKGPVFFKQRRIGLNGKPLYIYKFRTMVTNAEELIEAIGPDASLEDGVVCWHQDSCVLLIRKGDYIVREEEAKGWCICLKADFESDYQEDFAF